MPEDALLPDERFERLRKLLDEFDTHPALDRPLVAWVAPTDSHLPQAALPLTLRQLLGPDWQRIQTARGVGPGRILKLLGVMERVERTIRRGPEAPREAVELPPAELGWNFDPDALTETEWLRWGAVVERHHVADLQIGRFARSLLEMPQGVAGEPVGTYTRQPLDEMQSLAGYGPVRVRQVLATIADVVRTLHGQAGEGHLRARLLTARLHGVTAWVDRVLRTRSVADRAGLLENLVRPLLAQLEDDLGQPTAGYVGRRWGVEGPAETLDDIARSAGLTKERIRQVTGRAAEVFAVRWPEGRYLFDDFYELLQAAPDAAEALDLARRVFDSCFAVSLERASSRSHVLAAWGRAGRDKLTPMTAGELRGWLASEFPQISPDLAHRWVAEDGLRHQPGDGETLYFSHEPVDRLLHQLYETPEPMSLADAVELVDGDERNVRIGLGRDFRFIEDESRRVQASVFCNFFRQSGEWRVRLAAVTPAPRAESLPVGGLINLVVGGLLQAGVADATVWGVRRYADEALTRAYGAALPAGVTAFILGSMLVRHSDDLVRPMRRRRLRWDSADGSVPVRGKRGWVDHVVTTAGVPLTMDEVAAGLRHSYQDYEDYVLGQLTFDDEDEEGHRAVAFRTTAGNSTRLSKLFVPDGWRLNAARDNVGEGVRQFVGRVIGCRKEARYSRSELAHVPWVIELCEHDAYGQMAWADSPPTDAADAPPPSPWTPPPPSQPPRPEPRPDDLDGLLDRFL